MQEYHKIDTVFKRDPATKFKTLLLGEYAQEAFAYLASNTWAFSEKVDGTNIRLMVSGGQLYFGGRTDDAQIPSSLLQRLMERFLPIQGHLLEEFPEGACLYGEGYGAKIQKGGGNYRPDQDFVLFDVRVGAWWLERPSLEDIAQRYSIDIVPIVGEGTLEDMVAKTREGFGSAWGPFTAEGIVARPKVALLDRGGHRIITKIKHKDFARQS